MRWDDFRRSSNVEDERADSGGGGFNMPGGAGGLGIGTILIFGLIGWALGIDPSVLINGAQILSGGGGSRHAVEPGTGGRPARRTSKRRTSSPRCSATPRIAGPKCSRRAAALTTRRSWCCSQARSKVVAGLARSSMGPFYCPRDQQVYLDTSFFRDMQSKFGACSDDKACKFSEAYVIAHEVGHHVQDELGILPRVTQMQQAASSQADVNALQVRIELQADCLAGVWANHAQQKHNFLEAGDIDQALQTASAIGDDRLQKQAQGYVVPDSFTHGTSAQRKRWFTNGFNSGEVNSCNTL